MVKLLRAGGPQTGGAPRGVEVRPGLGGHLQGRSPVIPELGCGPSSRRGATGWSRRTKSGPQAGGPRAQPVCSRWSRGTQLATWLGTVLLVAAVSSGPIALGWQVLHPPAPAVGATSGLDERLMARRAVASEVATTFVRRWLTNTAATPQALGDLYPGALTFPKTAPVVEQVNVVNAVASAPGVWAVTVGADLTPPGGQPMRRFYLVPIQVAGEGVAVAASPQAPPAPVAGPEKVNAAGGDYIVSINPSGSLGSSVSAFLQAALTGQGEVTRYLTPGSPVRGLTAGNDAYAQVNVREIRAEEDVPGANAAGTPLEGAKVRVQVGYELRDDPAGQGPGLSAASALTLTARGGRWEVSGIDTHLAGAEQPPAPTTGAS